MSDNKERPTSDADAYDPLGKLTPEDHRRADKRAQEIIDSDDADFTERMKKFSEKKKINNGIPGIPAPTNK